MMKTIQVLRSIRGVYSVTWDAQRNIFRISGEVDPNVLLQAVLRTGEHAELLTVKLNHPQLRVRQRNYNDYGYGSYGPITSYLPPSHSYRDRGYMRLLPDHPYSETNEQYPYYMPSSSSSAPYAYENPLARATYVPSYPPQEYDPNANYEGINFCTIM